MKKYLLLLLGFLTCASPGYAQTVPDPNSAQSGLLYTLTSDATNGNTAVLSGSSYGAVDSKPIAIVVPEVIPYNGENYTVTGITYSFGGWTELRGVAIFSNVKTISNACFLGCTNLQLVTLSEGLQAIPVSAFQNCSQLKAIEVPSTVVSIGNDAFAGCTSLNELKLHNGLQTIGSTAFEQCTFTSLTIPESVVFDAINQGTGAFRNNTSLTAVTFNNVPGFIGIQMFAGCRNLATVTFTQTTPPAAMASDAFPTDHPITVKVPEGCQSAYAAKFNAYSNITIEEVTPTRRFIRVNDVHMLQPGGEYAVACVGTNTAYYPRYYQLNSSNQLAGPKIADTEISSDMIWTFHEVENKTTCSETNAGHNVGPMFSMSKTVNGEERYAQFGSTTTTNTYSRANDFELCPAKNTTSINEETGLYFVLHTNRNDNGKYTYVRGIQGNDGSVTGSAFSSWYELTNWTSGDNTYSTVHKVYLAVTEGREEIAARVLWNAKAEEYVDNYTEGKYTADNLAQCFAFPQGLTWSYDNLETEVAERFEAAMPRTRAVRVESAETLVDNLGYAIGTTIPATVTLTGDNYHPRFFELNLSTNASALTPVTDFTTFPGNMIWTLNREATHDCTNSSDNHKGKTYSLSLNGRYFTFSTPTVTKTATTLITQNYAEFIFKQTSDVGPVFKLHHVKQTGTGTAYNAAVGYSPIGEYGWGTYADIYVNGADYATSNNYSYAFQVYHVVKSWAPEESVPYFWNIKRLEVEASDFTPELKQQILAVTATMPEYAWSYEGIETEVAEQFNALVAPIIAEHLEGIANAMIDEHFSEIKTWVDANKSEWSDDLTALIDDTKDAINLTDDRTWTSEAIIEYVSGMYVELGIVNLEDMFTRLIAGKTYNLVSPHTAYEGNAVATNLEYNTTNNKARLIFDVNAGYTGFAFEAKEDATGLLIKEVATGKYMKTAPTTNNAGIEFSSDIDEAGTYYVKNATDNTESLFIWGEGNPDRFLHCNANTASTANTLFTYTGTSLQNQWNLHKTTDLAAYNAALKEEANKPQAPIAEYSTYGTKDFLTNEAIAAAAVNFCDNNAFTDADELTPATFAIKLEALAEYTYEKQDELWSGASFNGKNLLLLTGRAISENRYLKAENNALAAPQNGVSAESVWRFEHAGGNMYRIYNPETDAYIKADRSLTVQPEATEEDEEETEWNAADEAELFYLAKSTATNGDVANAICICSSTATGDQIALHKNSGTNDNMMYFRVNDMASEFFVKLSDADLAAAAKLPFPSVTYPDYNSYKTWDEPGYALGGYDPALQADAVYATTHIPTEQELAEYVDASNICSDNLIEVLHGRNTQVDKINAFLASKAFPQDGMYIMVKGSVGNGSTDKDATTGEVRSCAVLFDNGNLRTNNSTVSAYGNQLVLHNVGENTANDFNKIWFYKGGKMYSYASGHYLQGTTESGAAKAFLTISKEDDHKETPEAAANDATDITFVNAHNEVNEFQLIFAGSRGLHISTVTGGFKADACSGATGTKTELNHNLHIDLVTELPIEVHSDGFGSFAGHVAFQIPEESDYTYYYAASTEDGKIIFNEAEAGQKFAAGNVLFVEGTAGTAYVNVLYNVADNDSELTPAHGIEAINATHVALTHSHPEGKTTFAKTGAATQGQQQIRARVNAKANKSVVMQPVGTAKPVNVMTVDVDSDNTNINSDGNLVMPLGEGMTVDIQGIELRRADGTSVVFDLQGRRLSEPRKGAVNIIDGSKVYVGY